MGKNVLRTIPISNSYMELFTTACGKCICRYKIDPNVSRVANGKLSEKIINCYMDYYDDIVKDEYKKRKDIMKRSSIIEVIVSDYDRAFAIGFIGTSVPIAVFKLSNIENYMKDSRFISKIIAVFEEYCRDIKFNHSSNGCYYG